MLLRAGSASGGGTAHRHEEARCVTRNGPAPAREPDQNCSGAGSLQLPAAGDSSALSSLAVGQRQLMEDVTRMSGEQRAIALDVCELRRDVAELLAVVRGGDAVARSQEAQDLSGEPAPPHQAAGASGAEASLCLPLAVRGDEGSVRLSRSSSLSGCEREGTRACDSSNSEHLHVMRGQMHGPGFHPSSSDVGDLGIVGNHHGSMFFDSWPANIPLRDGLRRLGRSRTVSSSPSRRSSTAEPLLSRSLEGEAETTAKKVKRRLFDVLSVTFLIYDILVIPYTLAWDLPFEGFLLVMAWLSCVFWSFDILRRFLSSVYKHGKLHTDPRAVAKAVVSVGFVLDLGVMVCDWISMVVVTHTQDTDTDSLQLVRLTKAGRVLRIVNLLRVINFVSATEDYIATQLSENYKIINNCTVLSLMALVVNHWISCIWISVGRAGPSDTGSRWVNADGYMQADKLYQYVTAFHWSVAQLTGGGIEIECVNTLERVFNIAILVVGITFGSTFVSSLSAVMIDFQMMKKDKTQKMRTLRQFLAQNAVDRHIGVRVQQQAEERLAKKEEDWHEEDVAALELLSTQLRMELRVNIFQRHLLTHPLFFLWTHLDRSAVRKVCDEAVTFVFLRRKDDLFVAATKADSAYFIDSGTLHYIQDPDGSGLHEFQTKEDVAEGAWMCEAALWTDWVHVGRAEAATQAKVISISAVGVLEAVRRHRRVRDFTLQYAECFHTRVVTASPPATELPTDVEVPLTGWDDMVTSLDSDSQVQVGLAALEQLDKQQQASFSSFFRTSHRVDKLRNEVLSGRSCLLATADGEIQRVCSVVVLRIERTVAEDTQVLVELGTLQDGEVQPSFWLPGGKQECGELAGEALQRILSEKLHAFGGCLEVQETGREVYREFRRAYGMDTKFLRTIYTCSLAGEIKAKRLTSALPLRPARIGAFSRGFSMLSDPAFGDSWTASEREVLVVSTHDGRQLFLAWLPQEEAKRISTEADRERLSTWLSSLQHQLPASETPIPEAPSPDASSHGSFFMKL